MNCCGTGKQSKKIFTIVEKKKGTKSSFFAVVFRKTLSLKKFKASGVSSKGYRERSSQFLSDLDLKT